MCIVYSQFNKRDGGNPVDKKTAYLEKRIINKRKKKKKDHLLWFHLPACFRLKTFPLNNTTWWRKITNKHTHSLLIKMFPAGLKVSEPAKWTDHSWSPPRSRWPMAAWVTTSAKACDREEKRPNSFFFFFFFFHGSRCQYVLKKMWLWRD